tara:strand:+ start:15681 stop:15986 length:306 start_codon:yes stop_codon:yes gene_type:complete
MFAAWDGATRGGVMVLEETARLVVSKAEETCGRTFPLFVGFFLVRAQKYRAKSIRGCARHDGDDDATRCRPRRCRLHRWFTPEVKARSRFPTNLGPRHVHQ